MEEPVVGKRGREEGQVEKELDFGEENSKRHKPYNHILSLLDSEEEDSTEDLSPLMTTLEQEITCVSNNSDTLLECLPQEYEQENLKASVTCSPQVLKEEEEESDKERMMRHLLEASDDELGIPNSGDGLLGFGFEEEGFNGGDGFSSVCDKLWEFEDEKANYYALLQSELFLLWGH
ncbi:hypothetical protein VNO77_39904 [Canavalia gladiata]|uniref:Uncharacterized protein n=1 Tax=Canavalia gladiata TaxID=3824 RepID=A0AAN9JY98_CANGL